MYRNPSETSDLNTKLIFVPGAGCRVLEHYPKTCAALTDVGFAITAIAPTWDAPFEQLVKQVDQLVKQAIGKNVLVLAHSRGANIVMPTLIDQPHVGAIIASPSMTCAEGYATNETKALAEARYPGQERAVRSVSMTALAHASGIQPEHAAVLVGEQEDLFMHDIAHKTAAGFRVDATHIPEAPHFIDHHDNYIRAVIDAATGIRSHQMQ